MKHRNGVKLSNFIVMLSGMIIVLVSIIGINYINAEADVSDVNDNLKQIIVELDESPILSKFNHTGADSFSENDLSKVNDLQSNIKKKHQNIVEKAKDNGIDVQKSYDYTLVFNGMALKVPEDQMDRISKIPGVKTVHSDEQFHSNLNKSVPLIEAPEVWNRKDDEGNPVTGKGVTVAIIDTGIDYSHPDLGAGFGEGFKVVGGYDYVNDDSDPMDDNGHGTHVAGIVAADGGVTGVAPDASLIGYKVLDNRGKGNLSDILAALESAVDPANPFRADVINLSLSGPGDENSPLSMAATEAVHAGTTVVASAGNSGPGKQTITSPGVAEEVITVGASFSGVYTPKIRIIEPVEKDFQSIRLAFSANPPKEITESEVIDVGDGAPDDYEGNDVTGKTVLIKSSYNNYPKASYAEEQGAFAALFYEEQGNGPVSVLEGDVFSSSLMPEVNHFEAKQHQVLTGLAFDGRLENMVALEINERAASELKVLLEDQTVKISMTREDATDEIPAFSSNGPTSDFKMKPDLVAPGVEIKSTVPESIFSSNYYRMSGTSMAAPHVSGGAALLKQLHPNWTPFEVSSSLVNTAESLKLYDSVKQGAGRLNVNKAAKTTVFASPKSLSFGLADLQDSMIDESESITLANNGEEKVSFQLSVNEKVSSGVKVTMEPSTVTLNPGDEMDIQVNISGKRPDQDTDYKGRIEARAVSGSDGSDHPDLRIPFYLGAYYMQLYTTPDPAYDSSEAFIYSPVDLSENPVVTVINPDGETKEVEAEQDRDFWWRAPIELDETGVYKIQANGSTKNGTHLFGTTLMESITNDEDNEGKSFWQPIGPNGMGGKELLSLGKKKWLVTDLVQPGMFISQNDMKTWTEIRNLPVAGGWPVDTIVDPANKNNIYVAINGKNDPTFIGKIIATHDGGKTWTALPFPNVNLKFLDISMTGKTIVAASKTNLYISHDKGNSWRKIAGNWENLRDLHVIEQHLYFSSSDGLYVLKDFEKNDRNVKQLLTAKDGTGDLIAGNSDLLLYSTYFSNKVYASEDGGKTWRIIKEERAVIGLLKYEKGKIFVGTFDHTLVSPDNGNTWEEWNIPLPGASIHDVVIEEDGKSSQNNVNAYVTSTWGGIFETNDSGESYKRIGAPGASVNDLLFTTKDNEEYLVAGTQWDTYRTKLKKSDSIGDSIIEWGISGREGGVGVTTKFLDSPSKDSNIIYKVNKGVLSNFMVYKSKDRGQTWERKITGKETPYALLVHPANPDNIYVSYWTLQGSGLLISKDGGDNWSKVSRKEPAQAIVGDPNDPNKIWLGDNSGLYLSTDGGENFEQLSDRPISSIAIDPKNSEHLVLGGREFYHSYDGGHSIQKSNYLDLSIYINDLLFSTDNPDIVYAATGAVKEAGLIKNGRGILRSKDGGKTWENFSNGLNNRDTTSLEISADEKHLYVGTVGGSVYRIHLNNGKE